MKYKINDWIVFIDKKISKWRKKDYGISLYGKIGKIIDIDYNNKYIYYLVEFKEYINGYDGEGKGKDEHCRFCIDKEITLYKDYFKLKKLLEG